MRPILYSFRRCPFAIRARLALLAAGVETELREIVLRDKAPEFLATSPKATVPVLVTDSGVLEESLDIMQWALQQNDPQGWLEMPDAWQDLVALSDGPFKAALDRTKYSDRYDGDPEIARAQASGFLRHLDAVAAGNRFLFGAAATLADMAVLPFVRQFAHINRNRFDADAPPWVRRWLDCFLESPGFLGVMQKYPPWVAGAAPTVFPG